MWHLKDQLARLDAGAMTANVDVSDPAHGVFDIQCRHVAVPAARLFQLHQFSARCRRAGPHEFYVRGSDLVAKYERGDESGLHREVYWRHVGHDDLLATGIELIVSIRTDSLEDEAEVTVDSEIGATASLYLLNASQASFAVVKDSGEHLISNEKENGLVLHRLPGASGSCVEMVHPADFSSLRLKRLPGAAEHTVSTYPLFAEKMEKGVIRRARARALLLPSENDQAVGLECYRRFIDSPIPLTT